MAAFITKPYLEWLNDKSLMRYSSQRLKTHTYETSLEFFESFKGAQNYFWAIFDGKEMVGTATAYVNDGTADVGLLIGRPGQGYGRAAWRVILEALKKAGIETVTAGTDHANLAMRRICERYMEPAEEKDGFVYYSVSLRPAPLKDQFCTPRSS